MAPTHLVLSPYDTTATAHVVQGVVQRRATRLNQPIVADVLDLAQPNQGEMLLADPAAVSSVLVYLRGERLFRSSRISGCELLYRNGGKVSYGFCQGRCETFDLREDERLQRVAGRLSCDPIRGGAPANVSRDTFLLTLQLCTDKKRETIFGTSRPSHATTTFSFSCSYGQHIIGLECLPQQYLVVVGILQRPTRIIIRDEREPTTRRPQMRTPFLECRESAPTEVDSLD